MAEEKATPEKVAPPIMMMNYSSKVIHVGSAMLVPGIPGEVAADMMDNEQVQMLMEMPVEGTDHMALEEYKDASAKHGVQEPDATRGEHSQAGHSGSAQHGGQASTQHQAARPAAQSHTTR